MMHVPPLAASCVSDASACKNIMGRMLWAAKARRQAVDLASRTCVRHVVPPGQLVPVG